MSLTITQCIQRMSWIVRHWRKIEWPDRQFLLRKFRDEYPQDFWLVAEEKKPCAYGLEEVKR